MFPCITVPSACLGLGLPELVHVPSLPPVLAKGKETDEASI